jgi:chromosome segregation ATPase
MMADVKAEISVKDVEEVKGLLDKAQKDIAAKDKEIVALKAAAKTHELTLKNLNAAIQKKDVELASKPSVDINGVLDILKKIRASMGGQFGDDGWDNPADVHKLANRAIELLGSK